MSLRNVISPCIGHHVVVCTIHPAGMAAVADLRRLYKHICGRRGESSGVCGQAENPRCAVLRRMLLAPVLCIMAMLTGVSCAVHEWPEPTPAGVVLNLDFNTEMPQFMVLDADGTRASRDGNDYELRYTVEAYRQLSDGSWSETPHGRYTFTKTDLSDLNTSLRLNIDEGSYRFYVWTDFVLKSTAADFFYDTGNFRSIRLQGEHEGDNDFRDAFTGSADLKVLRRSASQMPSTVTVPMERPLAKFEFVSTDLQEFITKTMEEMLRKDSEKGDKPGKDSGKEDDGDGTKSPVVDLNKFRVVFYYSGYMPCAFNMMDNKPCDSATGVRFSSTIRAVDAHEARLGFDYVFVNGKESSVMVTVGLFDEEGTQLSMSNQIEVPIKRSMLTVVKGSFLMQNTGGGVTIDPGFDGEYNIVLR